jgi:hypothetical protein
MPRGSSGFRPTRRDRIGLMPVLDPERKALFDAYLATRLSN